MKLFIGNLSWDATEDLLRQLFEDFGPVSSVRIIMDHYSGRSKGFGFIEMDDDQAALEAIDKLNDHPLLDRPLRVSQAKQEQEPGARPQRGYQNQNSFGNNSYGQNRGFGGQRRDNGPRRFNGRQSHHNKDS